LIGKVARENRDEIFAWFVDSSTNPAYYLPWGVTWWAAGMDIAILSGTSIGDADDETKRMQWPQHRSNKVDLELIPCIKDDYASAICAATLTNFHDVAWQVSRM
jgi:hypothetical protein